MPDKTTARKSKNRGRPVGSVTRFPGSTIFANSQGVTATHFHRVLIGERVSRRLINLYAAFLRERGMPWPSAAKAKPEKF
jgi:hypothetical protein